MNDEEELNLDYDEYQYECCRITNEECNGFSCRTCEVAIREAEEVEEAENVDFCTFKNRTENGIALEINFHNTIAKCKTVEDFFTYMGDRVNFNEYEKLMGVLNHMVIDKEYPSYNTILDELKPKKCIESYYLEGYPLVAVHEDVVLVVAPRVYSDE